LEVGEEEGGQTSVLDVEAEKYCVYLVWTGFPFSPAPFFFPILSTCSNVPVPTKEECEK
jgi:hypothetical protein